MSVSALSEVPNWYSAENWRQTSYKNLILHAIWRGQNELLNFGRIMVCEILTAHKQRT